MMRRNRLYWQIGETGLCHSSSAVVPAAEDHQNCRKILPECRPFAAFNPRRQSSPSPPQAIPS